MERSLTLTIDGKCISASVGSLLSEYVDGEKPCAGHGKCGKCKVIAKGELSPISEAERKLLSNDEIEKGVRLACLTHVLGDCNIETFWGHKISRIVTDGAASGTVGKCAFESYGVAIDIGTTTLAARLYDTEGRIVAEASTINPQVKWGADVVSRIEASVSGKSAELMLAIRGALDKMIVELAADADIGTKEIDGVVITGNTVMLCLLTGESLEPFSHSPFEAQRLYGECLEASDLGLFSLIEHTAVYLPPCISAFVGADLTCAVLSTGLCEGGAAMLADIGTNGEMAIWNKGQLAVCSTAAGPAFEGVGIQMGMRGANGAVDIVSVVDGKLQAHVIGDTAPVGICGSGLIDAVACMLDVGVIDECGYLEEERFTISEPVFLTPKDIRMLQLAKSAICAGLMTLLDAEQACSSDVDALYIAGGFGYYLNVESASRIGLLPSVLAQKAKAVGNAALDGASMLLLDERIREKTVDLAKNARVKDLASSSYFSDLYLSGMLLEEM